MHSSNHDLASILHPISLVEFFSRYWESNPLVIHRGDATFYEGSHGQHLRQPLLQCGPKVGATRKSNGQCPSVLLIVKTGR
jgi:hypothetical protein